MFLGIDVDSVTVGDDVVEIASDVDVCVDGDCVSLDGGFE